MSGRPHNSLQWTLALAALALAAAGVARVAGQAGANAQASEIGRAHV